MFNSFSIRAKLLSTTALSIVIILVLGGMNFFSTRQNNAALEQVYENQVLPVSDLQEIDGDLKEVRFRMAGVLLDQMPTVGSLNHLKEASQTIPLKWKQFKEQTKNNQFSKDGQELIQKIDKNIANLQPFFNKLGSVYSASDKKVLSSMLEDEWPLIQSGLVKPLSQLLPIQQEAVKLTYEKSVARGRHMMSVLGIVMVASMVVILGVTFQLIHLMHRNIESLNHVLARVADGDLSVQSEIQQQDELGQMAKSLNKTVKRLREIVSNVKQAADSVAASSTSLSAEATSVMERAETQSDRVMQVSAAMEQMSVSVNEISTGATNVVEASSQTQAVARTGNEYMVKSMGATRRTVETVESSSAAIIELSRSIQKISEITKVIKDIADQTNLLALNAAIEAARAGEQGRGFAVVADEVRKLAERTTMSTSDITNMVDTIKEKTESSVNSMEMVKHEVEGSANYSNTTSQTLNEIMAASVRVTDLANHIASATKEQSIASEETARSMEEISSITEDNTSSIHQVTKDAESMAATAAQLQQLVAKFKLAV